jgi:hypothetical protein
MDPRPKGVKPILSDKRLRRNCSIFEIYIPFLPVKIFRKIQFASKAPQKSCNSGSFSENKPKKL